MFLLIMSLIVWVKPFKWSFQIHWFYHLHKVIQFCWMFIFSPQIMELYIIRFNMFILGNEILAMLWQTFLFKIGIEGMKDFRLLIWVKFCWTKGPSQRSFYQHTILNWCKKSMVFLKIIITCRYKFENKNHLHECQYCSVTMSFE